MKDLNRIIFMRSDKYDQLRTDAGVSEQPEDAFVHGDSIVAKELTRGAQILKGLAGGNLGGLEYFKEYAPYLGMLKRLKTINDFR